MLMMRCRHDTICRSAGAQMKDGGAKEKAKCKPAKSLHHQIRPASPEWVSGSLGNIMCYLPKCLPAKMYNWHKHDLVLGVIWPLWASSIWRIALILEPKRLLRTAFLFVIFIEDKMSHWRCNFSLCCLLLDIFLKWNTATNSNFCQT